MNSCFFRIYNNLFDIFCAYDYTHLKELNAFTKNRQFLFLPLSLFFCLSTFSFCATLTQILRFLSGFHIHSIYTHTELILTLLRSTKHPILLMYYYLTLFGCPLLRNTADLQHAFNPWHVTRDIDLDIRYPNVYSKPKKKNNYTIFTINLFMVSYLL